MIGGIDLFKSAEKVDLASFGAEFANFATSAFRLELLPRYHVESELAAVSDFIAGKPVDFSFNSGWYETIRAARGRGAHMRHVRGLPARPTPYVAFELASYERSQEAGEEFHFLYNEEIEAAVGEAAALPDFWLFDDQRAYVILYDTRGGPLGVVQPDGLGTKALSDLAQRLMALPARSLEWARGEYVHLHD